MSKNQRVTVQVGDDRVARVTLVRTEKSNALDGAMFDALIKAGESLRNARYVRAIVLSGAGSGFCAGIDMQVLAAMKDGAIEDTHDLVERTHGLCNRFQYAAWIWRELPMPVIAAVHGFALGGGLELALGADIRYATPDAQMSIMEVNWGLVPDMGGTVHFHALMRDDIVRELAFTGRLFDGGEALSYGLVTRIDTDPYTLAVKTAGEIASRSPDAVRALKHLFGGVSTPDAATRLLAECVEQQKLIGTSNQIETVRAFKEKRAPVFTG